MHALLVVVLVLGTCNRVLYKMQFVGMKDFTYFLSTFSSVTYCVLYALALYARRRKQRLEKGASSLTPASVSDFWWETRWTWVLIGACEAIGSVLSMFCAARISGYLLVLLGQATIPFTMLIGRVFHAKQFNRLELYGAALVVGGMGVTMIPASDSSAKALQGHPIYAFLYLISMLPYAISFATKQRFFETHPDLDMFIVNTGGSLCQLAGTALLFPIVCIPGFGGVPFDELGEYYGNAVTCFLGIASTEGQSDAISTRVAKCNTLNPQLPLLYMGVNVVWNVSLLALIQLGGATLTFISASAAVPLSNLAFAIPWPILKRVPLTWQNNVALVLVMAGVIIYRRGAQRQSDHKGAGSNPGRAAHGTEADVDEELELLVDGVDDDEVERMMAT